MQEFKFLWKYISRHKWRYIGGIATLFVVDFLNIYVPRFTGEATDGLTAHTLSFNGLLKIIAAILIAGALIAVGRFLWRFFLFGAARKIQYEIRNDMFMHLEQMSVEYYNEHKTGDLMSRFINDLNSIRMAIGMAVISAFDATVMAVMVICQMIFYVDLKLTLLAIIPMIFIFAGEFYYGAIMEKRFKEKQEALSDLTDMVQESFSGVRVIKAFVQERAELKAFLKYNDSTRDKNMSVAKLQAVVMPLLDVIIGVSSLITLLYGGYLALVGDITLGRFVAFNQYVTMLVWPMLAAGESITSISQGLASAKRVKEVLDEKPEIFDAPEADKVERIEGHITFNHLTFIHNGHTEPTLNDVCLDVPAGTTLAVIGRTGNGKSTLVNLLLHLYNTKPGMILIDGRDINKIPLNVLRANIAYVPQDNFLFSDTIAHNIGFGVDDATFDQINGAASLADVRDNIVDFKEGYETILGERGVTVSGGQKQRISIARALLKNAPILILDDSVSAVDTRTEKIILDNLKTTRAGKTTLLIAHRISTVEGMDKIVFLEDGRVEAVGTHDALYHSCPEYRRMVDLQRLEDETADSSDAVGTSDIADSVDAPEHASESVEKCEGGASHD